MTTSSAAAEQQASRSVAPVSCGIQIRYEIWYGVSSGQRELVVHATFPDDTCVVDGRSVTSLMLWSFAEVQRHPQVRSQF